MKIGITYNLKEDAPQDSTSDVFEEFDTPETIDAIAAILKKAGHTPVKLGFGKEAVERIGTERPDFIFNIAEGFEGRTRESVMPEICERFHIPYTGSSPFALALALDKPQAKVIVSHVHVKTPAFVLLEPKRPRPSLPAFPLFVKPALEGSSIGIRLNSRVENLKELDDRINWLRNEYGSIPVLIEQFIPGREITVGVLGNGTPYLLGIMEIRYKKGAPRPTGGEFIYSIEVKRDWENVCEYVAPAELSAPLRGKITTAALNAYNALGCKDIARIDFRVDPKEEPYFLEANPLPGLNPVSGDIVIMAKKMGWTHEKLVLTILKHAMERQGFLR